MAALDIGLHLLDGHPESFWKLDREHQIDLLAYRQIMLDRESPWRWLTMAPARLADLATHGIRSGLTETVSGLKAWLGANGVRFRDKRASGLVQNAERQLHLRNAKRTGASPEAVSFWLGA